MTLAIHGIPASKGIAVGTACLILRSQIDVVARFLPEEKIADEVERYRRALTIARRQLREVRSQVPSATPADITAFIDAHILMLDDFALAEAPIELIRSRHHNAEWALRLQRDALVETFEAMDDAYLRTRMDDVDHVVNRIQRILLASDEHELAPDVDNLRHAVVLAQDLTPADVVLMHNRSVAGFVTEYGAPVSHTVILARSLGIPMVVGVHGICDRIRNNELLIVDGHQGVVLADSNRAIQARYEQQQKKDRQREIELIGLRDKATVTLDGHHVSLLANIEFPGDIETVHQVAASGVGLYRTEFMYMNRDSIPDEEEQFETYRDVLESLDGIPLTIRTLDLGADKQLTSTPASGAGANPALGMRAIRLCLREPSLFVPQLRAILRASAFGPTRIMLPMLSSPLEVTQVHALIRRVQDELTREGRKFDPDVPVGGMIEVPAAAVSAEMFAQNLDFMSIGTNDLIQYTLAVDRIDDELSYLYDPLHLSVLRLISHVVQAGIKARIPVAMCGEMAGDIRYTRLLLGLGLTEFSMHPSAVLEVKHVVNSTRLTDIAATIDELMASTEPDQIYSLLRRINSADHTA